MEELEKKIIAAKMPKEAQEEGRRRVQEAQADVADVGRGDRRAQLHRHAGQPAVGEEDQDQAGPGVRRAGAQRGPLRPRQGQGPHPRVPRGAAARRQDEVADPVPGRASGRRQDLARPERGARDRAQVRPHGARRRSRRGRDPRPSPHLHRLDAGQGAAEPVQDRHAEPAVPARRDRQARHGLPRRPVVGAAGSARPGAEPHLQRPLRRGRLRPVGHDVHRDVELDEHPAGAARPDGGDPPRRATPRTRRSTSPCAICCPSSRRTTASRPRRWKSPSRRCAASSATTRARRACARSSARSPRSAARSSRRSSSSRSARRSSSPRTTSTTTWA